MSTRRPPPQPISIFPGNDLTNDPESYRPASLDAFALYGGDKALRRLEATLQPGNSVTQRVGGNRHLPIGHQLHDQGCKERIIGKPDCHDARQTQARADVLRCQPPRRRRRPGSQQKPDALLDGSVEGMKQRPLVPLIPLVT